VIQQQYKVIDKCTVTVTVARNFPFFELQIDFVRFHCFPCMFMQAFVTVNNALLFHILSRNAKRIGH